MPAKLACDVLIIGSGGAGLRAAVAAREAGAHVWVVSKAGPGKATCTTFSGGVFAAPPHPDLAHRHTAATLAAGRGINDPRLIDLLSREAPDRLRELLDWGLDGHLVDGTLYAHGRPPVWGADISRTLLDRNRRLGTRLVGGVAVESLKWAQTGVWAQGRQVRDGRSVTLAAKTVVLATGGAAALYHRHDNPKRIVGDGLLLALDAGATLQDLEFVQFYPLGLAEPGMPPFLIPPGVADAGRIVNGRGENLLQKYDIFERPAGEKARDRLSQAIFTETELEGRTVRLDLTGLPESAWQQDPFSASCRQLLGERYGADRQPLRIAPIAHHHMGGVCIDDDGQTGLPGLFAAGEVCGGIHGANRMGGNALSDILVFGARAGAAAARHAARMDPPPERTENMPDRSLADRGQAVDRSLVMEQMARLRRIMWRHGGICRSGPGLARALEELEGIDTLAGGWSPGPTPETLRDLAELQNAARLCGLILSAAARREESRGAHFREDRPDTDDTRWKGHLAVRLDRHRKPIWEYRPIV